MAKTKATEISQPIENTIGSLPNTISLDDFHIAVTEVYVHYLRNIALLNQDNSVLSLLSIPMENFSQFSLFSPELSAEDIGISYKHINHIDFAKRLDFLYDFAIFARLNMTAESMDGMSSYTVVSTLLADAAYGYTAEHWDWSGHPIMEHAKKCILIAEIANARCVLEGMEPFYHFWISKDRGAAADATGDNGLTIRQMALLSGMEEQSVRAAANPKRVNRLHTFNEDGHTRILAASAILWLKSKGRYMPVIRYVPDDAIDFTKRGFSNIDDLMSVIDHRYRLLATREDKIALDAQLIKAGMEIFVDISKVAHLSVEEAFLNDVERMKVLAEILKWPAEIFALRCSETAAKSAVSKIEYKLRELNQSIV
jgi:hypothetical protein